MHTIHAVWLACALVCAALFCIAPAQGQAIPEEGFPTKPVFPEESTLAPGLHEECGPFLTSDEFAEECAGNNGGNNGPVVTGAGFEGEGSFGDVLDPAWRTPPRLECPAAVFLEELDTGAIDCHAWDAAGAEHLAYHWEPIGGATRNYLENPRLTPEDVLNPVVVAPSFPQYDTLESFLSEEGTQRYRYRLTVTSRATGLSSWSEVEVFVLSSRPAVYCPLELEVEEGGTVALACEGADPLSFRMDDGDEAGASPVLWEWAGLWGASTSLLAAADTPAPLFTAPAGSAGRTYHYVASMTTSSSGVPRTARRRVSVTVKVGEDGAAPSITCSDSPYEVYEDSGDLTLECEATDAPAGATYSWTGAPRAVNQLTDTDTLVTTFKVPSEIQDYFSYTVSRGVFEYNVEMFGNSTTSVARAKVSITVLEKPNIDHCITHRGLSVDEGSDEFKFSGCIGGPEDAPGDSPAYRYKWTILAGSPTPSDALTLLSGTDVYEPVFTPPSDVQRDTFYQYALIISADNADDATFKISVTVRDLNAGEFSLVCARTTFEINEGAPDIPLECAAPAAPSGAVWKWTARNPTPNTNRLRATNISSPMFNVPNAVGRGGTWFYYNVSVTDGASSKSQDKDIVVRVLSSGTLGYSCRNKNNIFYEGDTDSTIGDCTFTYVTRYGVERISSDRFESSWTGKGTSDTDFTGYTHAQFAAATLSDTTVHAPVFDVPDDVDKHEQYVYVRKLSWNTVLDGYRRRGRTARDVIVTVLDRESFDATLAISCMDIEAYETGAAQDIPLSCTDNVPAGKTPSYKWEADSPLDLALLISGRTTSAPTFRAPGNVTADETYVYRVTVSADNTIPDSDIVTVKVLNKPDIAVACTGNPYSEYAGSGTITLDCEAKGAPGTNPDYTYAWTGRGTTQGTGDLSATDIASPTFTVPDNVTANKTYEYTLTATADNAEDGTAEVTVNVLKKPDITVTCMDIDPVYEGSVDSIQLDCEAKGAPGTNPNYTYAWTERGSTTDTNQLIAGKDSPTPTFSVPPAVPQDTPYEYTLTVSADNAKTGMAEVTVNVLKKPDIVVTCTDPKPVYEGSGTIALDCEAKNAPGTDPDYMYAWSARGSTTDTNQLIAGADGPKPTFEAPDVDANETYEYLLTVSAPNAEDGTAEVTVTVLNKPDIMVTCTDPDPVYEGSVAHVTLDCKADGAPGADPVYAYAWEARGKTPESLLSAGRDGPAPTFDVPTDVERTTKYEYALTVTAENAEDGIDGVTVTVLDEGAIALTCADPDPVYAGSPDFTLSCTARGALGDNPAYSYAWSARGDTPNTDLLGATDIQNPMFDVPDTVDRDTKYEYKVTATAANAEDGTDDVTVTVRARPDIRVACAGNPYSGYEGSGKITLHCSASGAPGDNPDYAYVWAGRGSTTNTDQLIAGTDGPTPTFDMPAEVDADETYEYLLTVSAENAETARVDVTVTVLNKLPLALTCANPDPVYEGEDTTLSCAVSGVPDGSTPAYAWAGRGATTDTALLVAGANGPTPTFRAPDDIDQDETYEYSVTVSAANAVSATKEVTVTVLNNLPLALECANPDPVYEGSPDIPLSCKASGAPAGSDYDYAWDALGNTPDTELLSAVNIASPTFAVPDDVEESTRYEYRVTATAEHADPAMEDVTVTVLKTGAIALVCRGNPYSAYEGSGDIALSCEASGGPDGSDYKYVWTPRGATVGTDRLVAGADGPTPVFAVPDAVEMDETYEYLLTVTAGAAEPATEAVTVRVLNKAELALSCVNPDPAYEGAPDIILDCSALGALAGSGYDYVWTPRGATADTDRLVAGGDGPTPTFDVPDDVLQTTQYEYLLTVSAENADPAMAEVTVTVLNKGALSLVCADTNPVFEGTEDITLSCTASGAPGDDPEYAYVWAARGATADTDRLVAGADGPTPTFAVPDDVSQTTRYEYMLTVTAENAEAGMADVTVTVLNKEALALACPGNPYSAYEGSADLVLNCSADGAPGDNPAYSYAWSARNDTGETPDTDLLSAADISSPTFAVPEAVDANEAYEYLLTVSAEHAESAMLEVTVTVLNNDALALVCANPAPVYEGSPDITFDCAASRGGGSLMDSEYAYVWSARNDTGDTPDTERLVAGLDGPTPTFAVPDSVDADETYEYLLTVSAEHADDATAEVTVTVLDSIEVIAAPEPVAFSIDPSALGVRTGVSSLRFGVQSSGAQVSLDPLTDRISTSVSGPYHAGRMTLASDGDLTLDENGEIALSVEMVTPVTLRRMADETADAVSAVLALSPNWSITPSCEQLSSQAIGGLHTNATLSESDCRLLLFGGDLDLSGAPAGRYAGNLNVILRTDAGEETHSVEVEVEVVSSQQAITAGPGGVRFGAVREIPMELTEAQNVRIYPDVAYLTRDEPSGAFELSNLSLIPLEMSVSARFGYTETTEEGLDAVVEDPAVSRLGDLSEVVDIHPRTLILMPGEQGVVRYGVREEALAAMTEPGYAAFFEVTSSPRQYVRTDQLPAEATSGKTARVTMRVPGAYTPGEGAPSLRATLLSVSQGAALSATFLVETEAAPFLGEVVAYDGGGRELGRRRTLAYTRSRVRVPLEWTPEGDVVFLRFAPLGSGRISELTPVPWNAPHGDERDEREIGAVLDKE